MKKIIITVIAIISVITLNSCGNSAKEQRLIEMRDSIQANIDWEKETIEQELHKLDSLSKDDKVDIDSYMYFYDLYMNEINQLLDHIDKNKEHLFQIELELNKK